MSYPKPCERCGKKFERAGKQCHFCEKCIRKAYVTRTFTRYGKFRDCKTLKEAISKYGYKK